MKKDRKIKNKIFSKLLTLTGIFFVASLFFTGCADFAGSSDSKKEIFTITVKTQNITSKTETKSRMAELEKKARITLFLINPARVQSGSLLTELFQNTG